MTTKMRHLTRLEIDALANRKGVKKIAVENFLGSLPLDIGVEGNIINCQQDARDYRWNAATVNAIIHGIYLSAGLVKAGKKKKR